MTDEQKAAMQAPSPGQWISIPGGARYVEPSIADTAGAKPVAQVSIRDGFIVGGINYGLAEGKHELFAAPPAPSVADAAGAIKAKSMREGFEAQRQAGINVDWFTWQIAWNDAAIAKESGND